MQKLPPCDPGAPSTFQQSDEIATGLHPAPDAAESAGPIAPRAAKSTSPVAPYIKAPLGRRYLAALVDAFIAIGPALSGVALLALPMSLITSLESSSVFGFAGMLLMLMAYILMLGGLVWFFVYYFLKDAWNNRASLGKRLFGLMVVDRTTNKPCTKQQSVTRAIGNLLPLTQVLDPLLVLQDPAGRRVGDHLAGTQVIERSIFPSS
jgi:uncharacterized RDD family membrane protein YckC